MRKPNRIVDMEKGKVEKITRDLTRKVRKEKEARQCQRWLHPWRRRAGTWIERR